MLYSITSSARGIVLREKIARGRITARLANVQAMTPWTSLGLSLFPV
jgi:hypothetical protein